MKPCRTVLIDIGKSGRRLPCEIRERSQRQELSDEAVMDLPEMAMDLFDRCGRLNLKDLFGDFM